MPKRDQLQSGAVFSQLEPVTLPGTLVPSAVSMRLERLDPLCMPFTIPEGGRSMAAGRAEEEEVVAVTSGGTEKLSKKGRKLRC